MRRFLLNRKEDITGVSGTGIVAKGVEFPSGKVVMEWCGEVNSIVIWNSVEEMLEIVTHRGKNDTNVKWVDESLPCEIREGKSQSAGGCENCIVKDRCEWIE